MKKRAKIFWKRSSTQKVFRTNLHVIFTPLYETNTQALRIHTVHFASWVTQHTWKLQFPLVVRCDTEVITFPARFLCHPIKLCIEISKAVFIFIWTLLVSTKALFTWENSSRDEFHPGMSFTSVSGHDPGVKFTHPGTISSRSSAPGRDFIPGSKIDVNTWFFSVPGRNDIFLCLSTYQRWMIILCMSVYGKDAHFVMNRFIAMSAASCSGR